MKLTQDEKRVRIAEACGWKRHPEDKWIISAPGDFPHSVQPLSTIPDYFNDLNAMHDAEKAALNNLMNADQWSQYGRTLMRLHDTASLTCPVTDEADLFYEIAQIATVGAAVRAEAFGRTLNLWNE